ncbi:MAG: DUF2834 domain-containing protein, partial [Bryobacteraceae bacterium]
MKWKSIYLLLCVAGAILPYWQFIPWLMVHGLDLRRLIEDLFANRISAFFAIDVIISTVVVFVFLGSQRARLGAYWWLPAAALLTVGVSLGLPLLLS